VIELYDQDATAANIRKLLGDDLRQKVRNNDQVFVFFAGHGQTDEITKSGSWIPVDGGKDSLAQTNWLPNIHVRNMLAALSAKHVFLISDACFSGDILDMSKGDSPQIDKARYRREYSLVSRQIMTSGASESVPDSSEFTQRLKSSLRRSEEECIDTDDIFAAVRDVKSTLPLLGYITGSDHQKGGSFLFFRRPTQSVPIGDNTPAEKPTLDSMALREYFNGDWVGTDTRLQINDNKIIQYFKNGDGSWRQITPEKQMFLQNRNNLVYVWLDTGGVWSETQIFSLSNKNINGLDFVWTRHVNNLIENDDNEAWHVNDVQTLFRSGSSKNIIAEQVRQSSTQSIPTQFHGNWIGEIDIDGRNTKTQIRLVITQNFITQYFKDSDDSWYSVSPDNFCFEFDRNNLIFVWLNTGGIWTETQAFSLSFINKTQVNIAWSRHVNNYLKEEVVNDVWHLTGEGKLLKQ
jgi:hypothetical protein